MERIQYVDVFRGVAILVMIFFHFIHTFAPVNVYADFPYFIASIGMFAFPPPPFLFLFVAGMSAYLLVTRRREQGFSPMETIQNVVVKYGRYVVLSLPFTVIVFGLPTWLAWEEALQGIGLTIIVLAILYTAVDLNVVTGTAVMLIAAVLQAYRAAILAAVTSVVPATGVSLVDGAGAVLWNATFGGYFSITSLLPFAVGGLLTIKLLHDRERPDHVLMLGTAFTAFSVLLTFMGYSLRFYARDVPLGFFGAGSAMLVYYAIYRCWHRYQDAAVFDALSTFGKLAFLVYIWSWILVIKVAQVTGIAGTIPHGHAYLLSTVVTVGVVATSLRYATFRQANGPLLFLMKNRMGDAIR